MDFNYMYIFFNELWIYIKCFKIIGYFRNDRFFGQFRFFSLANKKNIEQDHYFYKLLIFTIIFL